MTNDQNAGRTINGSRVQKQIDFTCHVCGCECNVAPDPPERAVCENHCPDHQHEYDPWRRDKFCKVCDKQINPDYWEET